MMEHRRIASGLTSRLLLVCLGLYVVVAALVTTVEVTLVSEQSRRTSHLEIESLASTFLPPLASALWNFNDSQLEVLLGVMAKIPAVGRVRLTTTEGILYEKLGVPGVMGDSRIFAVVHVESGRSSYLGNLSLEPSQQAAQAQVFMTLVWAVARTLLVVGLLSVVLVLVASRLVGRPLRDLAAQITSIDPQVPVAAQLVLKPGAGDELVLVADSFNALLAEFLSLNASLETKVANRTEHLEQVVRELSSTRDRLVESAKLAVLGHLVAGVVHDLNTPLGAALSASHSALSVLDGMKTSLLGNGELFQRTSPSHEQEAEGLTGSRRRRALEKELRAAGVSGVEETAETLMELGIAPPLGDLAFRFVGPEGLATLTSAQQFASLAGACRVMLLASEKMAGVVDNLLRYSRKEDHTLLISTDLTQQLETTMVLFTAALKSGVAVTRRLDQVPRVLCRPERLQQVWINLVANAIQAMDGRGTLELGLRQEGAEVEISIGDSGPGIPPEVATRLFTPFFTTKPRGAGTGLGLSICQRIVEEHGGRIEFVSVPGRTVFTVRLPVHSGNS